MVSYGMNQAIEKLAPIGNPWADQIGEPDNPWKQGSDDG